MFYSLTLYLFFRILLMIIIIASILVSSSRQSNLVVLRWRLKNHKSPLNYMTLLSILAGLSNAVISIVSILPLLSESWSQFYYSLVIVTPSP